MKKDGPGKSPARLAFMVYLIEAFILTQSASAITLQGFRAYAPPPSSRDTGSGSSRDSRFFDSRRAVERFQERVTEEKETRRRSEENRRDTQQTREVEQNVVQERKVSRAISEQGQREADFIYNRTTGLDQYSVDKDGGVWRSHLGLLAEAWNVLSRDIYGNGSRSHMSDFTYNELLNVTGFFRETVDPAGRRTETVVSDITYQEGEVARNFLSKNKEASRTEVTTVFHPTGNETTQTEIFDIQYDSDGKDAKVISQKARITSLSNPNVNPVLQESFNMKYDGEENLIHSETRVTDLVTGNVTESVADNQYSGRRLTSGVTESKIKDFINRTYTLQTSTQKIAYGGGGIQTIEARDFTTTQAMDDEGNVYDDFVTTTETIREMGNFAGIPETIAVVSVSKTIDNVGDQTIESRRREEHIRDKHGNLLEVFATEQTMTANFDQSVVQETESEMTFRVIADQPYLTGRVDRTSARDLIHGIESATTSHLEIQVDDVGTILGGTRMGETHATNGDGSIVTDSTFTQKFERAEEVNALALVRQETHSRTVNKVNESLTSRDALDGYARRGREWGRYRPVRTFEESVTEEHRIYTQTNDPRNRVIGAEETVTSRTTTSRGGELFGETLVEGTVTYAVGKRTNQPYAVEARNNIITKDPFTLLYTESTQVSTFESDPNTGRAIQGNRITDSTSKRMFPDGRVIDDVILILGHTEENLVGLEHANDFGVASRETHTEIRDLLHHRVTDQDEIYTQTLNGVGKIVAAEGVTRSLTQDLERTGLYQTRTLTETDYRIINGNATAPIATRTVEVTVSHLDGSYRIAARKDVTRYDDYGRILPINEDDPDQSGYVITPIYDVMVQPIPDEVLTPEQLFQQFFGSGMTP